MLFCSQNVPKKPYPYDPKMYLSIPYLKVGAPNPADKFPWLLQIISWSHSSIYHELVMNFFPVLSEKITQPITHLLHNRGIFLESDKYITQTIMLLLKDYNLKYPAVQESKKTMLEVLLNTLPLHS